MDPKAQADEAFARVRVVCFLVSQPSRRYMALFFYKIQPIIFIIFVLFFDSCFGTLSLILYDEASVNGEGRRARLPPAAPSPLPERFDILS